LLFGCTRHRRCNKTISQQRPVNRNIIRCFKRRTCKHIFVLTNHLFCIAFCALSLPVNSAVTTSKGQDILLYFIIGHSIIFQKQSITNIHKHPRITLLDSLYSLLSDRSSSSLSHSLPALRFVQRDSFESLRFYKPLDSMPLSFEALKDRCR